MRNKVSKFTDALVKVILFASSYIPLYVIIIFQLWEESRKSQDYFGFSVFKTGTWHSLLGLVYIKEIFVLIAFIIVVLWALRYLVNTPIDPNIAKEITIKDVENLNAIYVTSYFSVYIFPFITLNFTTFNGIATMLILVSLIGYVYIKNDLLFINPILHLFFGYNIYEVEVEENNRIKKITVLSRKSRIKLKTSSGLKFSEIGKDIWIEPSKIKKR